MRRSSLPGLLFPGHPDHYPVRDEVVAYLTDYARRFDLPVELSTRVTRLSRRDGACLIDAGERIYTADQVVIATGPRLPSPLRHALPCNLSARLSHARP